VNERKESMKRRKKRQYFKKQAHRSQQSPRTRTIDLEPEDLTHYVRRAEGEVLPIIRDMELGPGAAYLVLALHAQMLVTGDSRVTPESMMVASNNVLELWQAGYYTPGPEYPFSLEETLQEIEEGVEAKGDYAELFQPFTPQVGEVPKGVGEIAGGIVKHPETNLWQIWLMVDGPCAFFAAYQDPVAAQSGLAEIIAATRRGATQEEGLALYFKLSKQGDGEPKQLPYDMMKYLVASLDRYLITL
jgi:hypothetical protein